MKNKIITIKFNPAKIAGGFLTAGLLLFGSTSFAQTEDAGIDIQEERENVTNTEVNDFNQYDANADQRYDRDEFNTRLENERTFNEGDINQDNLLDESEYNEGFDSWKRAEAVEDDEVFEGVETETTDEMVTEEADQDVMNETGTFEEWDINRDNAIDQDEYNEGTFNSYDADRDGFIDQDEYLEGLNMYESNEAEIDAETEDESIDY